jgi:hypothetical protein
MDIPHVGVQRAGEGAMNKSAITSETVEVRGPRGRRKRLFAILDLLLVPIAFAFGPFASLMTRMAERAPRSRAVLDRFSLSLVKHHYYQPIVRQSDLDHPLTDERPLPGLNLNESRQLLTLKNFDYKNELESIPKADDGTGYFYDNRAFGPGDGEILYGFIRHFKPKVFIEIGCGFSTRMATRAIAANENSDPNYHCEQICIEPFEQPWLEESGLHVIRERVEHVDDELFAKLRENDILFIDSSHVIRPQGDVLFEFLELIPKVAPGVIIQVHDVYTPHDYPESWVVDRRNMWNEQYLLEAFLSCNPQFEILVAANWLFKNHPAELATAAPILSRYPDREPGSFWFRRVPA